ncbi:MAG TPA: EAL domain-containing protein [Actinotalea sp.]|nr:EAL domain-containing protein [Actinotalea sp.]
MRADGRPGAAVRWRDRAYGPVGIALLAAAVFLVATSSIEWVPPGNGVAAWWPAASISVLALAWAPHRRWAVVVATVFLATTAANVVAGRDLGPAAGFGLSNTLEALTVAWILVRRRGAPAEPRLTTLDDFGRFVVATLAGVAVMATGAGLTALAAGSTAPLDVARTVVASHGASILLLVPFGMVLPAGRSRASRTEVAAQWIALFAAVLVVFWPGRALPMTFLPLPLMVWGAVRLPVRTVAAQLIAVGFAVTFLTRAGGGPFAEHLGPWEGITVSFIEAYLVVGALIVLPLAVSVAQRREALERIAASERLFRQGFSDALLGMLVLRRHGGGLDVVELNDVAARLLGRGVAELKGSSWTDLLEAGDRAVVAAQVAAMTHGTTTGWHGELTVRSDDAVRRVEVSLSPMSAEAGDGLFAGQVVDVTGRHEAEERLTAQALADALTGLANRTLLRDRIDLALRTLTDDGATVVVLFCDLDDFKHINDSAGHSIGDGVLIEVAARLRTLLHPDDLAARLGGDEFVVLRPRCTDTAHAEALAARVLAVLGEPLVLGGQALTLGASIGIACGGADASADDLLRDADAAMYAAKAEGKRRAVVFSDEHRERALRAVRLETELRRAMADDELEVHLQPVVDLATRRVLAAEALVRWRHPERGLLLPGEWLDVAEGAGLMPAIGTWVLERSCELALAWPTVPGRAALPVHVNVSARQLEVPGFVDVVRDVLARTGLSPHRLVLECTETHLDAVSDALIADLVGLRVEGVGLAADDYGTGYSPLTRIIDLPVSMVKIDRRFVAEMLADTRSRAVVRALLRLSESLGLTVVAEGVETEAQAHALLELGCRAAQGFLWSRAVPADEFTALLGVEVRTAV